MNSLRSAVALRTLLCDTSAELASINSTILPDGATAYDNQSDTLWRLDKSAGTVFDALIATGLVVKPDDQTSARWIAEVRSGSSPYYNSSFSEGTVAVAMSGNQWNYLGTTPGNFTLSTGNTAAFDVDATTGVVTYHGPPRLALVTCTVSLYDSSSASAVGVQACISRSGDVVAGTTNSYASKGEVAADLDNSNIVTLTTQRIVLLNPSTTLRLALRNPVNADDFTVVFYQLTIAPL